MKSYKFEFRSGSYGETHVGIISADDEQTALEVLGNYYEFDNLAKVNITEIKLPEHNELLVLF